MTFSQVKTRLDSLADELQRIAQRINGIGDSADGAEAALNALPTNYSELISEVDAMATASPDDPAILAAKAEKDLMVAEYQAAQDKVAAVQAALA